MRGGASDEIIGKCGESEIGIGRGGNLCEKSKKGCD
jgi:hypothetical protein